MLFYIAFYLHANLFRLFFTHKIPYVTYSFITNFFFPTLQQISRDYGGQESDYMTDNASVMTDYTCDSFNGSRGGSDNGDADYPEWQEFWDEQAQGKYWYNNISGTRKCTLLNAILD